MPSQHSFRPDTKMADESEQIGDAMPELEEFIDPESIAEAYDVDPTGAPSADDDDDDDETNVDDPEIITEVPEGMMEVQDDSVMGFFGHKVIKKCS